MRRMDLMPLRDPSGPIPERILNDVGWGTYGFKAGPVSGEQIAAAVATGATPELIAPFALSRFAAGALVGEKGAAAVGH